MWPPPPARWPVSQWVLGKGRDPTGREGGTGGSTASKGGLWATRGSHVQFEFSSSHVKRSETGQVRLTLIIYFSQPRLPRCCLHEHQREDVSDGGSSVWLAHLLERPRPRCAVPTRGRTAGRATGRWSSPLGGGCQQQEAPAAGAELGADRWGHVQFAERSRRTVPTRWLGPAVMGGGGGGGFCK